MMIKSNQLPIEVMNEFHSALLHGESYAEAFAAALSAWPGIRMMVDIDTGDDSALKLPLPQEVSDDA